MISIDGNLCSLGIGIGVGNCTYLRRREWSNPNATSALSAAVSAWDAIYRGEVIPPPESVTHREAIGWRGYYGLWCSSTRMRGTRWMITGFGPLTTSPRRCRSFSRVWDSPSAAVPPRMHWAGYPDWVVIQRRRSSNPWDSPSHWAVTPMEPR